MAKSLEILFFPYITNLWNNLDVRTQVLALHDFKVKMKGELKPKI